MGSFYIWKQCGSCPPQLEMVQPFQPSWNFRTRSCNMYRIVLLLGCFGLVQDILAPPSICQVYLSLSLSLSASLLPPWLKINISTIFIFFIFLIYSPELAHSRRANILFPLKKNGNLIWRLPTKWLQRFIQIPLRAQGIICCKGFISLPWAHSPGIPGMYIMNGASQL